MLSGEMEVVHNDGTKAQLVAGTAYVIEPGHDAWVVGNDPAVDLEFESVAAETYAKASREYGACHDGIRAMT
jgi:hypothetical protein